jgi:hypothetical protein
VSAMLDVASHGQVAEADSRWPFMVGEVPPPQG